MRFLRLRESTVILKKSRKAPLSNDIKPTPCLASIPVLRERDYLMSSLSKIVNAGVINKSGRKECFSPDSELNAF